MRIRWMLLIMAGIGCDGTEAGDQSAVVATAAARPAVPGDSTVPSFAVETVAEGLIVPWALAFAPDGRIFVTERAGSIRVIRNGVLDPQPWATVKVAASGEAGLMGIAIAPDFAQSHAVYVVATFRTGNGLINRLLRFTENEGRGQNPVVVLDRIPSARFHAGDALAFGPDGMLYVATGDATEPTRAQDPKSLGGKILRLAPNGDVPADNPVPGSLVFAYGLRNPQGIAWDSATGQMFVTDHGPSGFPKERFRRNHDELNAILPGGDHGWPKDAGHNASAKSVKPLSDWDPAIAPSGLAMYTGRHFPRWHGSLFVGALRATHLRRVSVERDSSGWLSTAEEIVVQDVGRVRAVAMGPDGYLYFTTSNQDGRGDPGERDDRVLRIIPAKR